MEEEIRREQILKNSEEEGKRKKITNKCKEPKGCGKCFLILRALFSLNKLMRIGPTVACAL